MISTYTAGPLTDQPPLMIVHGLYGSARNWGGMVTRLSDARHVVSVDLRNHGDSPWYDTHSYDDLAADLAEVIAAHGGVVDLMGHSMGGKASMVLTLQNPHLVRKLVVADIAPVAYSHTQGHLIKAMKALNLEDISSRRAADNQLAQHVESPAVRAFLLQSLDRTNKRWKLNLDVLDAFMSDIVGWPGTTGEFSNPTLFLSGAESDYVLPEHRPHIKALFPKARFARIPRTGHWLHADRPDAFEAAMRSFLG